MVVGEMADRVDLLVIGGGPGGYTAAKHAASLGASVLLVDSAGVDGLGGSCLHVGCIPSKALIEVGAARHRGPEFARHGIFPTQQLPAVDMAAFQQWKGGLVGQLAAQIAASLKHAGVVVESGAVRFSGPRRAVIQNGSGTARFVEFDRAVIATGSRPAALPSLAVDQRRILDSTGILALAHVPVSVTMVGAGYIGVELGIALAKLGSVVTLVESADRILAGAPQSAVKPVLRRLDELGVTVLTGHSVRDIDDAGVTVCNGEGRSGHVDAEIIGVAVGRVANTDELGLAAADIELGPHGLLKVDMSCRITPHIAAIGDVTPGPALAHRASSQAIVAAEALCGKDSRYEPAAIPAVIFCDPEVAYAGVTAEEANQRGMAVRSVSFPMKASGRARTLDQFDGATTLVVERDGGRVVGAQVVGPHASEIIGQCVLAIEMEATAADVVMTVLPHPTIAESISDAAMLVG